MRIRKIIYVFLLLSLISNVILYLNYREISTSADQLTFLDPVIAESDLDVFREFQESYVASYLLLRKKIDNVLVDAEGNFSIYFEDLDSHTWMGINEREKFTPASLLKLTVVSTVLKLVEEGKLSLDQKIPIEKEYLNSRFGTLAEDEDSILTVKKLIEITITKSDNTAANALSSLFTHDDWVRTRLGMGTPITTVIQSQKGNISLSPKQFSGALRSLYVSSYLNRQHSNWILSLMAHTDFKDEGIPAGVPPNVPVSHKIGQFDHEKSVHDCAIVYAKKRYILCIMSRETDLEEGNRVIEEISRTVYDHVSKA